MFRVWYRWSDVLPVLQIEVDGDITSLDLSSLISQTEYDVAVTPIYDDGPGSPMLGSAITGLRLRTGSWIKHCMDSHQQFCHCSEFLGFLGLVSVLWW